MPVRRKPRASSCAGTYRGHAIDVCRLELNHRRASSHLFAGRLTDMEARLAERVPNYTVPLTAAFQRCRAQLPWWRIDRDH
jgi:hypothetical protein